MDENDLTWEELDRLYQRQQAGIDRRRTASEWIHMQKVDLIRQLHHALMIVKADAEKNGFTYGNQSVCMKALAAYTRWETIMTAPTVTQATIKPRPITLSLLNEFDQWTRNADMFRTSPEGQAFGEEVRSVIELARKRLVATQS